MRTACEPLSPVKIDRIRGRLAVRPERRVGDVARRLQEVFGISSVSPAWGAAPSPEEIARVGIDVVGRALEGRPTGAPIPFRVSTNRGDKSFPLISTELDRFVAERVLPVHGERLVVRLGAPELELGIDVRRERAYLYAERLAGPGGLPVGTLGRGLCLLSGGIDSPVAAWMAMKRGCAVSFVSFHSYPYIGESAKRKIVELVRVLARWQPRSRLFVVPFTDAQVAVRDHAPEAYRTVLYRRMMQRIASRLARRAKAGVLITGESLGQVASQTMENLTCIGAASGLPVIRPLVAFDKEETIALAKRIGTYDVSILPEPDCCTVFQPTKPVIRGTLDACEAAEAELDVEGLVAAAVEGVERIDVEPEV